MTKLENKKFVLIARGKSHIRYFKRFARASELDVSVIRISRTFFLPRYIKYLQLARQVDVKDYLASHLAKKRIKFPLLSTTWIWTLYEFYLATSVRFEVAKYCGVIEQSQAHVVGVWNGQKLPSRGVCIAARLLDKEVVYFENGLMPNSTTCDWKGVNCHNSLPRAADFYRQLDSPKALPQTLIPRAPAKQKAKGISDEALPERYIFVPFQVETDSQIISNSAWIKSMEQLWTHLKEAIERCEDPQLHVVIKEHPSELKRFDHLHHLHPKIKFANACSTQDLILGSLAVLTVNSTVGLESLLLEKPVLVLGDACYAIPGVSVAVKNESELCEAINALGSLPIEDELRKQFLRFTYEYYVIPQAWVNADERHFQALTKRLVQQDEFSRLVGQ